MDEMKQGDDVYCSWVGKTVSPKLLGKDCRKTIVNGGCNRCTRSDQLDLGMSPEDLLRNLRGCT